MLVRHLPPESSVAHLRRDGEPHWTVEAHLLDELRMATVGTKKKPAKPHPQRPTGQKRQDSPERRKKLAAAKRRAVDRQTRIASGEIA